MKMYLDSGKELSCSDIDSLVKKREIRIGFKFTINDSNLEQFATDVLSSTTTLKTLRLDTAAALESESFCNALAQNDTIEFINLQESCCDDDGAIALASILKMNSTLQTISLNDNHITDVGAKALAEALAANHVLRRLYLNNNMIDEEGAKALTDVMSPRRIISLKDNNFDDDDDEEEEDNDDDDEPSRQKIHFYCDAEEGESEEESDDEGEEDSDDEGEEESDDEEEEEEEEELLLKKSKSRITNQVKKEKREDFDVETDTEMNDASTVMPTVGGYCLDKIDRLHRADQQFIERFQEFEAAIRNHEQSIFSGSLEEHLRTVSRKPITMASERNMVGAVLKYHDWVCASKQAFERSAYESLKKVIVSYDDLYYYCQMRVEQLGQKEWSQTILCKGILRMLQFMEAEDRADEEMKLKITMMRDQANDLVAATSRAQVRYLKDRPSVDELRERGEMLSLTDLAKVFKYQALRVNTLLKNLKQTNLTRTRKALAAMLSKEVTRLAVISMLLKLPVRSGGLKALVIDTTTKCWRVKLSASDRKSGESISKALSERDIQIFQLLWKTTKSQDGKSSTPTNTWQPFKHVDGTKILKETTEDIAGVAMTVTNLRTAAETHAEQYASEDVKNALAFAEGHSNRIANQHYRRNSSATKIAPWANHIEKFLSNEDSSCEDARFQGVLDRKIEEDMKKSQKEWEAKMKKKIHGITEDDRRSKLPKYLNPRLWWSKEEDAELTRLVKHHGKQWDEIYDNSLILQQRYKAYGKTLKVVHNYLKMRWKTLSRYQEGHGSVIRRGNGKLVRVIRSRRKGKGSTITVRTKPRPSRGKKLDLSDVPPQLPIPIRKHANRIKEDGKKYVGAHFDKVRKKWHAFIKVNGKQQLIGSYDNEEEAAADYARAVLKCRGREALNKARLKAQNLSVFAAMNLSDVPPQPPIMKSADCVTEFGSKYVGISFKKAVEKWEARISVDGKLRHIGYYENEEEAAIDYARAVFKYRDQKALGTARDREQSPKIAKAIRNRKRRKSSRHVNYEDDEEEDEECNVDMGDDDLKTPSTPLDEKYQATHGSKRRKTSQLSRSSHTTTTSAAIDLSDVPHQPLILRDTSRTKQKQGGSKYQGVSFHKATNKWQTTIRIEGKQRHIGYYESEEEAAADYARAAFKYSGQGVQETNMSQLSEPSNSSKSDRRKDEQDRVRSQSQKERTTSPVPQPNSNSTATPPTTTDDTMYEVEAIVGHRYHEKSRTYKYRIKWFGYGKEQNTWEPKSHLHPKLVEEYWEGLK